MIILFYCVRIKPINYKDVPSNYDGLKFFVANNLWKNVVKLSGTYDDCDVLISLMILCSYII